MKPKLNASQPIVGFPGWGSIPFRDFVVFVELVGLKKFLGLLGLKGFLEFAGFVGLGSMAIGSRV